MKYLKLDRIIRAPDCIIPYVKAACTKEILINYHTHRRSALLQLHLQPWHNTFHQWIGQRQLQGETKNIWRLGFGASYIRDLKVVTCHRCSNIKGNFVKTPLNLGHGWVTTPHVKQWMWLITHVPKPINQCLRIGPWSSTLMLSINCGHLLLTRVKSLTRMHFNLSLHYITSIISWFEIVFSINNIKIIFKYNILVALWVSSSHSGSLCRRLAG